MFYFLARAFLFFAGAFIAAALVGLMAHWGFDLMGAVLVGAIIVGIAWVCWPDRRRVR